MWWLKGWQEITIFFSGLLTGWCFKSGQLSQPLHKEEKKDLWKSPSLRWALVKTDSICSSNLSLLYPKRLHLKVNLEFLPKTDTTHRDHDLKEKKKNPLKERENVHTHSDWLVEHHSMRSLWKQNIFFTSTTTHFLTDVPLRMLPMEDDQCQTELSSGVCSNTSSTKISHLQNRRTKGK